MSSRIRSLWKSSALISLVAGALFGNGAASAASLWEPNERSGLGQDLATNIIEKTLSVPLNPDKRNEGNFDLYYYVERASTRRTQPSTVRKTVLFAAGGPGELARLQAYKLITFLPKNEYDVVYFDIRGAGVSQIPPGNDYDRFLRSSFAVNDMEEIRRDLLGKGKWEAIVGYSYGTVLAQQYASRYPENVSKLILVAPLSRHGFVNASDGYDKFAADFERTVRDSLNKIYSLNELAMEAGDRAMLLDTLFGKPNQRGIYQRTEDEFGSIQFAVDAYCRIQTELKALDLDYSRTFFQQLRNLRVFGWSQPRRKYQLEIAYALKKEILDKQKAKDSCPGRDVQRAHRVFDVIGTYDGITARFLREWEAGEESNFETALTRSAGEAHVRSGGTINTHIDKVGTVNDPTIKPWDPAGYKHSVPTLIIKGGADPVTAGGQAEYVYSKALTGARFLVESPGSGHELVFPAFKNGAIDDLKRDGKTILSGTIHLEPVEIPPGQKRLVTGKTNGLQLNEHLRIMPPQVEPGVNVRGAGVFLAGTDKRKDNVFVEIENKGDGDLPAATKMWNIESDMFSGTVRLNLPPIPKGQTIVATGTLVAGERRKDRQIFLRAPDKLEPELRYLCFRIDKEKQVNMLFANSSDQSASVDGQPRGWVLYVDGSETTFAVDPPEIPKGEAKPLSVDIPGVEFDTGYQIEIESPQRRSDLRGVCVPNSDVERTESEPAEMSIFMWNSSNSGDAVVKPSDGEWKISNPFFTLYLTVGPLTVPPRAAKEGKGTITGFAWNNWLDLKAPKGLDQVEAAGFNVLSPDEISVLIWNKGSNAINAADRDWTYVLNEDGRVQKGCDSSYSNPDYIRDCLIYSFLVMRPSEFDEAAIFDAVASHIEISDPTDPQKLLKITKQHCAGGSCELTTRR